MKQESHLNKSAFFEFNHKRKILEGVIKTTIGFLLIVLILAYLLDLTKGTIIEVVFTFLKNQFAAKSLKGAFFIGALGGLFFLSVPIEVLVMNALITLPNNPVLIVTIVFIGLCLSYAADYAIGRYFSNAAKKIVSPKQFYNIKVKLNEYGKWLIFIFNVLPLPSQLLTMICGVFKYNKTRYFTLWAGAWVIKLTVLVLFQPQIEFIVNIIKDIFI